jgi:hypothetical protein
MMTVTISALSGSRHQIFGVTSGNGIIAFSIARTALKMALPFENEAPVLVRPPSRYTVHLQPVGLAV